MGFHESQIQSGHVQGYRRDLKKQKKSNGRITISTSEAMDKKAKLRVSSYSPRGIIPVFHPLKSWSLDKRNLCEAIHNRILRMVEIKILASLKVQRASSREVMF